MGTRFHIMFCVIVGLLGLGIGMLTQGSSSSQQPAARAPAAVASSKLDIPSGWRRQTDSSLFAALDKRTGFATMAIYTCPAETCGTNSRLAILKDAADRTHGRDRGRSEALSGLRSLLWDYLPHASAAVAQIGRRDSEGNTQWTSVRMNNGAARYQEMVMTDFPSADGRVYVALQVARDSRKLADTMLHELTRRWGVAPSTR